MQTPYTKVAKLWHVGMVASGLDAALRRYMRRIELAVPDAPRVLDVGCGTGVLSHAILERYPRAQVLATDADERMAQSAARIAARRGISSEHLTVGVADIHEPAHVRLYPTNEHYTITPEAFDLVITGAVLEHADLSRAIPALADLVAPGGSFLNVGMGELPVTKVYEKLYGAAIVPRQQVISMLQDAGFQTPHVKPLAPTDIPANLTRCGIVARKPDR
jgi:2-polyprenyl-3-methyl-5-hydroxy-6-metoxy-1,4-benzoquinol methylase